MCILGFIDASKNNGGNVKYEEIPEFGMSVYEGQQKMREKVVNEVTPNSIAEDFINAYYFDKYCEYIEEIINYGGNLMAIPASRWKNMLFLGETVRQEKLQEIFIVFLENTNHLTKQM